MMRAFLLNALALVLLAQEPGAPQSVRDVRGFDNPERLLRGLVAQKGRHAVNRFCIVGYRDKSGDLTAWVHWKEGAALILWEPTVDKPAPLSTSRRYLNLKRHVVESEDEIKGSTYLVTRSWVERVQSDCDRAGDRYTIKRKSK